MKNKFEYIRQRVLEDGLSVAEAAAEARELYPPEPAAPLMSPEEAVGVVSLALDRARARETTPREEVLIRRLAEDLLELEGPQ